MAITCPNKSLKAWKDLVKIQGEDISYALWNAYDGMVPDSYYSQVTQPIARIKKGVLDVFKSNPELENIGTQQQYSQYLDTIFPDSKVKDIVYHGSLNKIETFDKSKLGSFTKAASAQEAIFFTDNIEVAKTYAVPKNLDETEKGRKLLEEFDIRKITPEEDAEYGLIDMYKQQISNFEDDFDFDNVSFKRGLNKIKGWKTGTEYEYYSEIYPSILNLKNPKVKDFESKPYRDEHYFEIQIKAKEYSNDGTILKNTFDGREKWGVFESNIYTVFEPEQIHILGSKQDIEGFKEFVKNNSTVQQQTRGQEDPLIRAKYFPTDTVKSLDIVKKIAESNHPLKMLAQSLIPYVEKHNIDVELLPIEFIQEGDITASGIYYKGLNKIEIAEYSKFRGRGSETTLLHEIIHSLTVKELEFSGSEAVNDIRALYEYAKNYVSPELYGMTNEFEFISELMTNAEFIRELSKAPPSKEVGDYNNLFEEVIDYILSLFGFGKRQSLYTQAFAVVTNIMDNYVSDTVNFAEYNEITQPGEIEYSLPERDAFASQAVISDNNVPRPYYNAVMKNNSQYSKPAVVNNEYIIQIKHSENKRYIANKYFRYRYADKSETVPHYPFTTNARWANERLIGMINSEFLGPVVKLDEETNTIIFSDTIDAETSVNEVQNIIYEYVELPKVKERMEGLQEEIVGQEDIMFLEVDPQPDSETKRKEQLEKKLSSAEEVINRKKEVKRLLGKRIASGSERRSEIQARIDRINAQITELEDNLTPIGVILMGKEDSIEIENRLNKIEATLERVDKYDAAQLWNVLTDLNELSAHINGWLDVADFMDFVGTDVRDDITNIEKSIRESKRKLAKLQGKAFLGYANKTSFKKFTEEELMGALVDEGTLSRLTLGAHFSNSEIVKIVNDSINRAAYHINKEAYEKRRELDLWLDKLKKHTGISDSMEISKMFLQYTKDGKWTGNIVGKISQEYFDRKRALYNKAVESQEPSDWTTFYNFVKANSVEMNMTIYKARKHSAFAEEDFKIQDKLLKDYEDAKSSYKKQLEDSGIYGTETNGKFVFSSDEDKARFESVVSEWDRINRPFDAVTGQPINIKGGSNWKYRLREKPDATKWADPNYKKIEKDPVLLEFYNFLIERFKENNANLPHYGSLQSNYLPEMRRTALDNFTANKGLATAMSLVKDTALDVVSEAADSEVESGVTIAGVTYKSIPVSMMGNRLKPDEKSMDIFKVTNTHTKMALNYKYKSQVEPLAIAAQDLIKEIKEIQEVNVDGSTTYMKDIYSEVIKRRGELFNTRKRLEYLVNAELYDQRRKSVEPKGKKVSVKSTGEGVVFSSAKVVDSLIKFTYVKALSMPNIVTPAVNLTLGVSQNYIYASAGRNIDVTSLNWAYVKMLKTINLTLANKLNVQDAEMIVAWMRHLNILDDINEAAYGSAESWDRWLTQLQSKGEYVNQGAIMLAYLKKNKLKDKDGNDIAIIDAYKIVDGMPVWDSEKMGEQSKPEENEILSEDGKGVNMFRLRMKIKGINFYIHGDYASALQGKETALGRSLMLFKTWLFQTWMHRFGGERFDPNLQETVKGRYKSYLKATAKNGDRLVAKDVMKLMLKGIFSKKAFDILNDVDRDNLIRNLREAQITSALTVTVALLTMALRGDDDPDRNDALLTMMINMLSKTQSDLAFYLDPSSASQVLNNLIPIISTFNDIRRLGGAVTKTMVGNYEYESGPNKDRNRILVDLGRAVPVTNGAIKMINMASQVYSYN